jgi:transposase
MAYLAPHNYISIQPLQSTLIIALAFKNPDLYTIYTRFFELKKKTEPNYIPKNNSFDPTFTHSDLSL